MWTVRRAAPSRDLSDWERAERDERMRHALWLVAHGASVSAVASECGLPYDALRRRARRQNA